MCSRFDTHTTCRSLTLPPRPHTSLLFPAALPYSSWDNTSLLCQVDSEASLDSWARALDENVDLRPQQSEEDRAKVDIELKAKEMWNTRQEGLWGGL